MLCHLSAATSTGTSGTAVVVASAGGVCAGGGGAGGGVVCGIWVIASGGSGGPSLVEGDAESRLVAAQRSRATPTSTSTTPTSTTPTSTTPTTAGAHGLLRSLDLFTERQGLVTKRYIHMTDRVEGERGGEMERGGEGEGGRMVG